MKHWKIISKAGTEHHYDQDEQPLIRDWMGLPERLAEDGVTIIPAEYTIEWTDTTVEYEAHLIECRINMMDQTARAYVDKAAHWSAGPKIFEKAKTKPKSAAIVAWVESVWTEFWTREAQLKAGAEWNEAMLDFSVCGPCPHKISEALSE